MSDDPPALYRGRTESEPPPPPPLGTPSGSFSQLLDLPPPPPPDPNTDSISIPVPTAAPPLPPSAPTGAVAPVTLADDLEVAPEAAPDAAFDADSSEQRREKIKKLLESDDDEEEPARRSSSPHSELDIVLLDVADGYSPIHDVGRPAHAEHEILYDTSDDESSEKGAVSHGGIGGVGSGSGGSGVDTPAGLMRFFRNKTPKEAAPPGPGTPAAAAVKPSAAKPTEPGATDNTNRFRYSVSKKNKYGIGSARLLELDESTRSLRFLDTKGKIKSEFPLTGVQDITAGPNDKTILIVFVDKSARSYVVVFPQADQASSFLQRAGNLLAENVLRKSTVLSKAPGGDSGVLEDEPSTSNNGAGLTINIVRAQDRDQQNDDDDGGGLSPSMSAISMATGDRKSTDDNDLSRSRDVSTMDSDRGGRERELSYIERAGATDGSGRLEYLDYHVRKRNRMGRKQSRILVLHAVDQTLMLFDDGRKFKKSIPLGHVLQVEIPEEGDATNSEEKDGYGVVMLFSPESHQRPFTLLFNDAFDRIHFVERLGTLCPNIMVKDETSAARDQDTDNLRFVVIKVNKLNIRKRRILYLDMQQEIIRSLNVGAAHKDIHLGRGRLLKVEKSIDDKLSATLFFRDRPPWNFIFADAAARERFVYYIRQILHRYRSLGSELMARDGMDVNNVPSRKFSLSVSALPNMRSLSPRQPPRSRTPPGTVREEPDSPTDPPPPPLNTSDSTTSVHTDVSVSSSTEFLPQRPSFSTLRSNSVPAVLSGPLSIFIGSWNVGGSAMTPSTGPSDDAALVDTLMAFIPPRKHDIYVIGLQECNKSAQWLVDLRRHICQDNSKDKRPEDFEYVLLTAQRLWEIGIFLFVHRQHVNNVLNLQVSHVATGVGNRLGNKGAVALSFRLEETSLCFVCSHLAARAERVSERRENYVRIVHALRLGLKDIDILHQFHHVFWFGDLNYRIDYEWDDTLKAVENKDWPLLQSKDQLLTEMNANAAFLGFSEGKLNFMPTYRWERDKNEFSNKRNQSPSWTDRVLWRSLVPEAADLRLDEYGAAPDVMGSDHRPIFAIFTLHPRGALPITHAGAVALPPTPGPNGQVAPPSPPPPRVDIIIAALKFTPLPSQLAAMNMNKPTDKDKAASASEKLPSLRVKCDLALAESDAVSDAVGFSDIRKGWVWGQHVKLSPFVYDPEVLRDENVLVTILEGDECKIPYGHTVVPLRQGVTTDKVAFKRPILKDGILVGYLSGESYGRFDKPSASPPPANRITSLIRKSQTNPTMAPSGALSPPRGRHNRSPTAHS